MHFLKTVKLLHSDKHTRLLHSVMLSVVNAECDQKAHYAEFFYAEYHYTVPFMLSITNKPNMLIVVMLSDIMLCHLR